MNVNYSHGRTGRSLTSYHRRITVQSTQESPRPGPREPFSDPPPSKYYRNASYLGDLGELLGRCSNTFWGCMDNLGFSSKLLQIFHNVYQRHHPSMASLNKLWVARLWKFRFLKDSSKTGTNWLFLLWLVLILRMKHHSSIKPLTGDAKIWGNLDYPYTIRQCLSIYLFPILKSWQTYPYPYLGITWVSRVLSPTSSCNK